METDSASALEMYTQRDFAGCIRHLLEVFRANPSRNVLTGLEGLTLSQILAEGLWPESGKKLRARVEDSDFSDPRLQPFLADALFRLPPPTVLEILQETRLPLDDPRWHFGARASSLYPTRRCGGSVLPCSRRMR